MSANGDGKTMCDLEDVAPILALVIEPLVQHLHDLDEVISGCRNSVQ